MNHLEKHKRKIHPIESTNVFSKYLFLYTLKFFRKNLREEDLYEVPINYESKIIDEHLEKKWKPPQIREKKVSVVRLLLNCYGLNFFLLGLMKMITSAIMLIVQPYTTGKLISYFAIQTTLSQRDAYFYAALLIVLKLLNCIFLHNYYLLLAGLGIKVRTALCTLIYKKILKVDQLHFKNIGKVLTLITKDVNAFKIFIDYGNDVWIGMFQTKNRTGCIGWNGFLVDPNPFSNIHFCKNLDE
ncbi:ABC membrane domain containing protein, partial [Asbolus verrucosus]